MNLTELSLSKMFETRAPSVAVTSPINYTAPGYPIRPRWDAERAINQGYLAQTYVFAAVDRISDSIARHPFRAGSDPENPSERSTTHPLAQLLGPGFPGPNPEWSPKQFWKYTIAQYILCGKFAWLIEREKRNGRVIGLWPLQAQHLLPIEGGSNSYFAGFEYGSRGSKGYRKFRNGEIIYRWRPSQADFRQPESWLESAALDISIAQMIDQYDYALLKNGAIPATIVTHEQFAEADMRRAFRQQFMSQYGGTAQAGKTMFLEAGPDLGADGGVSNNVKGKISVERLALTANELMSNEKRVAVLSDVCIALRTPMSILGDSTRSKFTNMESDYRNWWTETLVPLAEELTDHVNTDLAPKLESSKIVGWFDFSKVSVLKDIPRFSASDYKTLVEAEIMERDEARSELGFAKWADIAHPEPAAQVPSLPIGSDLAQPLALPPAVPKALPAAPVKRVLQAQKAAVVQRQSGRRGRSLTPAECYDSDYWRAEMTPELGARAADRIADITARELTSAGSIEEAFTRVEREIRGSEPIGLDYVAEVLNAIKREKIEPSKAVDLIWN